MLRQFRWGSMLVFAAFALFVISVCTLPIKAQTADKALFSNYKGVSIGTTQADVRAKLGTPKESGTEDDFFVLSEFESVQVYYEADKKVMAVSVTFSGKLDSAPTPKQVFGTDAEVKPNGGIFKMEKYPKQGYWVSYTKTGGDDPLIMIAMKKL